MTPRPMLSCLFRRRAALSLALALALPPAALFALAPPRPALAQDNDALYGERMDKGLKLFADKNYDAAIAEFYAAYKLKPRAAPLINIALSYKAQFKYAKAVAALEEALAKHADTLEAKDRKATEAAIKELKSLLAYVTLRVSPPNARVTVDGEEIPAQALSKPVALPTGPHVIRAAAEGYAPLEKKVEVVSGQEDTVELKLVPTGGHVTIEADDPRTPIFVDNQQIGFGRWAGVLPTGPHIVEFRPPGAPPQLQRIEVAPGSATAVRPETVTSNVSPLPLRAGPKEETFTRSGAYILGVLSTFSPLSKVNRTEGTTFSTGLRIGYQVSNVVGFELSAEYGRAVIRPDPTLSPDGEGGELSSLRLAPHIRLTSPGRSVRFLFSFGVGYVNNDFEFAERTPEGRAVSEGHNGVYFQNELGIEFEVKSFLIDLVAQNQTLSHGEVGPFFDFELHSGWGLRVGRGFW